jgi:hypothetical protein
VNTVALLTTLVSLANIALAVAIYRQGKLMSQITDFAAKVAADEAHVSTKLDSISAGVAELDAKIKELVAIVAAGSVLTSEEQAALDAVSTASAELAVKADAINTSIPV